MRTGHSGATARPTRAGGPAGQGHDGKTAVGGSAAPMRAYQLYLRVEGAWSWLCTLDAPTHADAFRQVLLCLRGDEPLRPIRVEEDTEGTFRKPCERGCGHPSTEAKPRR
jgi:hypothetical protein